MGYIGADIPNRYSMHVERTDDHSAEYLWIPRVFQADGNSSSELEHYP